MLGKALLSASVSAPAVYVEDVFSTYLYTGNGSTQTITNGIDLSGKGGLVWIKGRSGITGNRLTDTARGATKSLESNTTAAAVTESTGLTSFSSTGFALGADADYSTNAATYASWTFREQPKFFDVVTYTGTGSNTTIAHNLGSVPGAIWVKRTDTTGDWQCYHRSLANTQYMVLNSSAAAATGTTRWNSTTPTSSVFSLGTDATVNASAGTYVAYLFAHNAGGFGLTGTDNVISCGTYTGNGSELNGTVVNLGYEPQFLLIKAANDVADWFLIDNMRGWGPPNTGQSSTLRPNLSNAEASNAFNTVELSSTGFKLHSTSGDYNGSAKTYIYIAIRRGPMKTPTTGTSVFEPEIHAGNNFSQTTVDPNIVFDLMIGKTRNTAGGSKFIDRLRGLDCQVLDSAQTSAESPEPDQVTALGQTSITFGAGEAIFNMSASVNYVKLFFRRAPSFFDVVCYTGGGTTTSIYDHNLGVVPELIIIKSRSNGTNVTYWPVKAKSILDQKALALNNASEDPISSTYWPSTNDTATQFRVVASTSAYDSNATGYTYVAYLFATCAGVSKVGSYTGTGTTLNVDCGFTAGARFVMIKRTNSTGNWYVWDTARGIVSGNDPYSLLNSTAVEVTGTDYIDPLSSGFQISSTAPAAINANGSSFIFLAIA